MPRVHAAWSETYTYCDAYIENGIKAIRVTTTRRVTCARCRTVLELAITAGGPMRGEHSPEAVFESSYDSMVNRYADLYTPEYIAMREEVVAIEKTGDELAAAARKRARSLRRRLAAIIDDIPCRCNCDDLPCMCRRCSEISWNGSRLDELSKPATKSAMAKPAQKRAAAKPAPTAASEPALPEGPHASPARHRRLAKKLYLMAGLDGEAFNTWLVNETPRDIEFTEFTGEFGPGASPLGVTRPTRTVPARSAILFEEDAYWGLDWSVWWEVFIVAPDGAILKFRASRGKYGYSDVSLYEPIPYTDKRGMRIEFRFSDD